jgi:hypothetical protein
MTILRGEVVAEEGRIVVEPGFGRAVSLPVGRPVAA